MNVRSVRLKITGMTCQGCAEVITWSLEKEEGVVKAEIDYHSRIGVVTFDPQAVSEAEILGNPIFSGLYKAELAEPVEEGAT